MALHFEGTQQIKAPLEKVWQFVLNPNKVAECAPGFKSMEILADDHFKPTIVVRSTRLAARKIRTET